VSIITDIHAHMTTHAGLSALIVGRCYPVKLPQTPTLPAVTYQRISSVSTYSQDGDSNLYRARWQFSCWSTGYVEAFEVAQQVKAALNLWKGTFGDPAFIENMMDFYEPETGIYHHVVDATIWWGE